MKGKCYYCNKELTERTIKRHMKNCSDMKKVIDEEMKCTKGVREQFIISIKDKYASNVYCIYVSIDANLQLQHLDKFIRDVWVECCGHLSAFYIDGETYDDNRNEQYKMNVHLKDVLNIDGKFEYQYDFGSTTHLILEVVDIIKVPKEFSQIEIIARNDGYNSPRDGVCGYHGSKDTEIPYIPKNDNKYKVSKKKPVFDYDNLDYIDAKKMVECEISELFDELIDIFVKGKNSFDLEVLLKSYSKNQLKDIVTNNELNLSLNLNKADIVANIISEYENMMENKIRILDENIYKILLRYTKNKGVMRLSSVEDQLNENLGLMNQGIIFPSIKDDEPIFIMPEVMQNIVKQSDTIEVRKLIKYNGRIINIFRGMIKVYGILKFSDFKELIKRYTIDIDDKALLYILKEASSYYSNEYYLKIDYSDELVFINEEIDDYEEILEKLDKTSEYAMINEKEIISMSKDDYLEKSSVGKTFITEFSSCFELSTGDIIENMNDLAILIQFNDSEELLDEILNGVEENLGKDAEELITNIFNQLIRNIRLWRYKGATLNEKKGGKTVIRNGEKVGRNDPCPCGSGKKYKNCCAKEGNVIKLF